MHYVADSWHLRGENKYPSRTLRDMTDPKVTEEIDFEATVAHVEAMIESVG